MADEIEYSPDDVLDVDTGDVEKGSHSPVLDRGVSVLAAHDDPFAPRAGKTLTWKNVNMTLVCYALVSLFAFDRPFFLF